MVLTVKIRKFRLARWLHSVGLRDGSQPSAEKLFSVKMEARVMRILIGYNGTDAAKAAMADLATAGLPDGTEALIMTVAEICARPENPEEAKQFPKMFDRG